MHSVQVGSSDARLSISSACAVAFLRCPVPCTMGKGKKDKGKGKGRGAVGDGGEKGKTKSRPKPWDSINPEERRIHPDDVKERAYYFQSLWTMSRATITLPMTYGSTQLGPPRGSWKSRTKMTKRKRRSSTTRPPVPPTSTNAKTTHRHHDRSPAAK